jgi:hypothetical protein
MATHNKQNPMPLENLPGYLKSARKNGIGEDDCIVDIGRIQSRSSNFPNWTTSILSMAAICMALGSGLVAYNKISEKQIIVVVDANKEGNPLQTIPKIISDNGDRILAIAEREDSKYEIKVSTRKSRKSLLDFLNKNKNVKNAE